MAPQRQTRRGGGAFPDKVPYAAEGRGGGRPMHDSRKRQAAGPSRTADHVRGGWAGMLGAAVRRRPAMEGGMGSGLVARMASAEKAEGLADALAERQRRGARGGGPRTGGDGQKRGARAHPGVAHGARAGAHNGGSG